MSIITVNKIGKRIFYKVNDDHTEYYDLDFLVLKHPELRRYLEQNKLDLNRIYLQQKELHNAYDTIR